MPSIQMLPPAGSTRRNKASASVDLPQPGSQSCFSTSQQRCRHTLLLLLPLLTCATYNADLQDPRKGVRLQVIGASSALLLQQKAALRPKELHSQLACPQIWSCSSAANEQASSLDIPQSRRLCSALQQLQEWPATCTQHCAHLLLAAYGEGEALQGRLKVWRVSDLQAAKLDGAVFWPVGWRAPAGYVGRLLSL